MLKGKNAVITGSTSGIGLGIAEGFAKEGINLVLNGFGDAAEIEKLRAGLASKFGVKVLYDGADMSKPEQIEAMMRRALSEMGGVDILINNAGIQHVAPVEEFPLAKWDAIIAINLSSAFHTTRVAVRILVLAMLVIWLVIAVMLSNALFVCSRTLFMTLVIMSLPPMADDCFFSIAEAAILLSWA